MSSEMLEEIRQLEVETFEVVDLTDAGEDSGVIACIDYCSCNSCAGSCCTN